MVLLGVENTLNTRPLPYLYDEVGDLLTPHFLCGFRTSHLFDNITSDIDCNEDHDKLTRRLIDRQR